VADRPAFQLTATVFDAPDPRALEDVRVCLDPAGHTFCLWVG
jgi:hypothetical protein